MLRIRFTQPSRTNDPFEAELCLDLEDEALIAKKAEDKFGEAAAAQVMQEFRKDRQRFRERAAEEVRKIKIWDDMGILSLSATENDLLMWAHYTSSHAGMSHAGMLIEFNPKHPFFNYPQRAQVDFGVLVKVTYSTKRRPRHRIGDKPALRDFCIKSKDWRYEQEWRVFRQLNESDNQVNNGNETVYLFDLPPESVKRVVMGCRMERKKRQELKDIVSANPALRDVQIQEAKLDLDTFRLEYRPT